MTPGLLSYLGLRYLRWRVEALEDRFGNWGKVIFKEIICFPSLRKFVHAISRENNDRRSSH